MTTATVEGPLGFPMTDRQALALDAVLKNLPKDDAFRYRKAVMARGPTEVLPGERSDVSWITTEAPDRDGEVVTARGMNETHYKRNPIVTMQHNYSLPPVGRSLWRKVVRDGRTLGVKAKTLYPGRPACWLKEKDWPADCAFALVQADLLRGKSIGFLPTRVHRPSGEECRQQGWDPAATQLVIDEWILLEYACTFLPAQAEAVVEAVSKSAVNVPPGFLEIFLPAGEVSGRESLHAGLAHAGGRASPAESKTIERPVPFVPLEDLEAFLVDKLAGLDFRGLAERAAAAAIDRRRGRV